MKARHKKSRGGSCAPAGGPGTAAHLEERHGAITHHRKRGGKVEEEKELGKMHGESAKNRLDRPGRKRGGRIGADTAPLSSAGRGDHPHSASDEMGGPRGGEPGYGGVPEHRHMHHRADGGRIDERDDPAAKKNVESEKGSIAADEEEGHRKRGGEVKKKK